MRDERLVVSVARQQERFYDADHDYAVGSPHIRHHDLRARIVARVQQVVCEVLDATGSCRVLEVGAGHGTFTEHLVAMGADVVVTEMSAHSAAELEARFRHNDRVRVVLEQDGTVGVGEQTAAGTFDVVFCLSVLHHIPDYLAAVRCFVRVLAPGGAFVCFQDPLLYSRRSSLSLLLERSLYLLWRLPRGDLRRGLGATVRRSRGRHDESEMSDMVEYHVVRDGVDEVALQDVLRPAFGGVTLIAYWSAQAGWAQALGRRLGPATTFGIVARDRRPG